MIYLTYEEVLILSRRAVERYGGIYGLASEAKLRSALGAIEATFDGELLLPSLMDAASGYWFYICNAHAFVDGNKRTAVYSVMAFLHLNGFDLDLNSEQVERITFQIARGELTRDQLVLLIKVSEL